MEGGVGGEEGTLLIFQPLFEEQRPEGEGVKRGWPERAQRALNTCFALSLLRYCGMERIEEQKGFSSSTKGKENMRFKT